MRKKTLVFFVMFFVAFGFVAAAFAGDPPKDERKHTKLGKYVNSAEAYEMWKAKPDGVYIVDCRTPEEYVFVGHAPMAHNIPSMLWTGKWDAEKKQFSMAKNENFEAYAKKKFKPEQTIMVMCRSGHRSAASVNRLAEAGFTNVYNIVDGFEGDMIKDEESYYDGKRMKNGWKNSGAPWTYSLDANLVYIPAE